ncbi:RHS repeat domain-containing protein, partial [Streptomyces daliensis]
DCEGNLVTHTDPAGHTTAYSHTHFDMPATRTGPDGARYAFAYDTELRLTTVTNPQGLEWRYTYDAAGRLTSETDFNGATRTYTLDAAGRLTAQTNALGQTLRYELDAAGRVLNQHDEATGEETTYTYDPDGALLRAANASSELTLTRDALGRVLSETVNGRTTRYAYDAAGNRTHRTTPSGLTSTWTYDAAGRAATLTTGGHTLAFTHDAAGRETQRAAGAVTLTQDWDATGRLTTQALTTSPGDTLLQHRAYTYRPDGYLTEIRELTTGTRHFALDTTGRVTGVQAHGWSETYAYDSAGNQTHAEAPAHPAPGAREHTGTLIHRAGRTTYTHDAAGRLVRKTRKLLNGQTRTWTYTWNTQDRLTQATTPLGEEWAYTYDPLGRRLTKTGPDGASLTFTWDATRLAEQTTRDGATTTWDHTP